MRLPRFRYAEVAGGIRTRTLHSSAKRHKLRVRVYAWRVHGNCLVLQETRSIARGTGSRHLRLVACAGASLPKLVKITHVGPACVARAATGTVVLRGTGSAPYHPSSWYSIPKAGF